MPVPSQDVPPTSPQASADLLDSDRAGRVVVRGGTLRAAGYLVGVLMSAASAPLMIRYLGVVDFGRYVTVTSIIGIVAALTDVGLTNLGVREYTLRRGDDRPRLLRDLLGMRLTLSAIGVVLAVAFASAAGYPPSVVAGTGLAGLGLLLTVVQATYQVPLSTALRLNWLTAIDLVKQAVTVAFIVALVLAGAALEPFFLATVAAGVVAVAVTVPLVRREISLRPSLHVRPWLALLREAPAYAVASAIGFIYFRIEVVLISLLSTAAQTGYFSAAFRIVEVLAGIPFVASMSAFPVLARTAAADPARFRSIFDRMFDVYVLAGIAVALGLGVGAPFIVQVVAGPHFEPSVPVLRVMGASMIATFVISTWSFALLALRRHAMLLCANLGALALAIVLTLALVPTYGAIGAATAAAATEVALAVVYGIALLGPGGSRLAVGVRPVWAGAVAAAAAVAVVIVLDVPAAGAAVLALAVYVACLFALRAVPAEMIAAFRRRPGAVNGGPRSR
jgi:O-antigen/teichoic acid export membrane protein